MKGKYLIAIAFLASWTVIAASELPSIFENGYDDCPAVDSCPPKLISHESDCTKYYECKGGRRELRACAAGYYFSLFWRGCVDRQNSDCSTPRPQPPFSTTTPSTPTIPGDCVNGDRLPHECQCTKFYECKYGRRVLRECPANNAFHPGLKNCQPSIGCEFPTTKPTTTTTTTTVSTRECDPEGVLLPHECQCDKYYQCKNGRKALRECKKGWHFDKVTKTCIEGAECGECSTGDVKKHECGCTKYYKCYNEEWIVEYCLNGDHFNEAKKTCMDPAYAGCERGLCPKDKPSRWPHECDCRLFYECKNEKKIINGCDWGMYFNRNNLICEITSNVKDCKNTWDSWA